VEETHSRRWPMPVKHVACKAELSHPLARCPAVPRGSLVDPMRLRVVLLQVVRLQVVQVEVQQGDRLVPADLPWILLPD
jgi:hypothetical protein